MKKLITLAIGATLALPAAAETTLNRIHVDAGAAPGGDGTTWALAFQDLRAALTAAAGSVDEDEIWVASGTYYADPARSDRTLSFTLQNGVAIYGGFSGSETDLGERDANPITNGTVLSGDLNGDDLPNFVNVTENTVQIVVGTATDSTAVIDGFTISGGFANDGARSSGAGLVCNQSGSPTVARCRFMSNRASLAGGAVSLSNQSPAITAPTFIDCTFSGNLGFYGGAVDTASSQPAFDGCRFVSNTSSFYGGAVFNYYSGSRFIDCSFRGNSAAYNGGAIYFNNYDTVRGATVVNSEFIGNSANFGGACYGISFAAPVFTNASFAGNGAATSGGGCYFSTNCTPRFNNSILWNNAASGVTSTLEASTSSYNSTPSFAHCVIANSGGSTAWIAAAGTDLGGNLDVDPLFLRSPDPTAVPATGGNLRLGLGSPAANAGDNTADLDGAGPGTDLVSSLATDLGGGERIQDLTIDMGAFEGEFENLLDSFAALYPLLDPELDENLNGTSNFVDYATGGDPTASDDPACRLHLSGDLLVASKRINASDVNPVYKKSDTLGGWTTMVEGVDYQVQGTTTEGNREQVTLRILIDPASNPKMFFVQDFLLPSN